MNNSNKQNNNISSVQERYTLRHALVNYYLVLMFAVFPLFVNFALTSSFPFISFENGYFSIRHDKYYMFLIFTGLALIAELLLILTYSEKNKKSNNPPDHNPDSLKNLSFTDWAMVAFMVANLISTVLSSYFNDAVWGTAGRNNGLLLMLFYAGAYLLVSRFLYYKEYTLVVLSVASMIVCLLAVLNTFYIDPLGMYKLFTDQQTIDTFISTIGNRNLVSSYICITLPIFATMSVHTKRTSYRIAYLVACAFSFMALMTADSDSGVLGIGLFALIYIVYYSREIAKIKKFFLALTIMLTSAKVLMIFAYLIDGNTSDKSIFQNIFVYSNFGYILIALSGVITAVLYLIDSKKPNLILSKAVPITLGSLLLFIIGGALGAVVYFSCVDTTTGLGSLETILRFNDRWGTHRGYMWIRSMWIFSDASIMDKLFGTGPDTFYHAFKPYFSGLMAYGDSSTNAAHNEYLNYLITIGITGLAAYLAIIGGTISRAIKAARQNPLSMVFASAVICYSIQAIVNIAQPITTPLFIIFIAMCENIAKRSTN